MTTLLSGALAERCLDMHLLTFDAADDVPFFKVDPAVTRHFINSVNPKGKTKIWEMPGLLWRLRKQVKTIKPDIVVAFMHSMFVPLQCALLGTGIKVVLSEHTAPLYYKTRKAELWILRLFSHFAHSITIVSEAVCALYPREMQKKMVILPNPVHSDFEKADVVGALDKNKTILSVGRLDPGKDHQILLNAFCMLAEDYPDWNLLIMGDGPERQNLETIIAQNGMERRIALPGVVGDMDAVYKSAHLFVMPSRFESFGLVTAEAMSHALPVIGFADCSGTNELVKDGKTGVLVEERTASDLASAIRVLIDGPALRQQYGNYGHGGAQKFSSEAVCMEWLQYLEGLVAPSQKSL